MGNEISSKYWEQNNAEQPVSLFMDKNVLDIVHPTWQLEQINNMEIPKFVKSKFGIEYSLQPFLIRELKGFENLDVSLFNKVFPKICQFNLSYLPKGIPKNWEIKELKFQRLLLDVPLEFIEYRFSDNVKRAKKKENEYSLTTEISLNEYFDFVRLNNKYFKVMKIHLFEAFKKLIIYFDSIGKGELLAIENSEGKIEAISYYLFDGDTIIDFKGASTKAGKKKGAMAILHIKAIRKYHGQFKYYDFFGANASGRAHFNRKFGSSNVIYYQFTRLDVPKIIKSLIRKIYNL